MLELIFFHP